MQIKMIYLPLAVILGKRIGVEHHVPIFIRDMLEGIVYYDQTLISTL